jgi:hypothetical protein
MSVRAKFTAISVTKRTGWGEHPFVYDVSLRPVSGTTEENKAFYAASPSGSIEISTLNEAAANQFQPGVEYYVTFEPAVPAV